MSKETEIRLRKNLTIGAPDAETDRALLHQCFVSGSDYQALTDCADPRCIVLGRTGAGKSALLIELEDQQQNVIRLDPGHFAFSYIENSAILKFVTELGVNLDLFYRLLWRHVLAVELLKKRYDIVDEGHHKSFLTALERVIRPGSPRARALEYVREWGDRFWEETETRVKELTQKIEQEIGTSVGTDLFGAAAKVDAARALSTEQKQEIKTRATAVVNRIQIKRLSEVVDLLAEHVFDDRQRRYYVVIDNLDENWSAIETRCRIIRALIEELKTFRTIGPLKIVVALRRDLLSTVFNITRDSGFQEEKYDAYLLPLKWSESELKDLINKRINATFERQYSRKEVGFNDVFPTARGGESAIDFILSRTLRRPRDVIQFVNEAFALAEGRPRVSWDVLRKAEASYSEKRLKALFEEWHTIYPALSTSVELLRGLPPLLTRSQLKESLQNVLADLCGKDDADPCSCLARDLIQPKTSVTESDVLIRILQSLYQIGAIGIKGSPTETYSWAYLDQPFVSEGEIKRSTHLSIHKMLWRALDVQSPRDPSAQSPSP